ncbi:hypothetical protein BCR32DRAFT_270689 [Anaeromyces robustus]|uniref:Mitochondrial import inner membrane translocase subunit TIM54 n=1 Tax=Anaeromyces robustus TaxID=1754192 RepID=A0A1Y1WVY9_9FUNG|nr:hypothetical protein BCR32DRAFT_270689 [Anaeromyces robustus]|eukprot:ORX77366.1 hypothetical protein BCR32DRAFT_270689 [Anaeromyces robustus]
MSTYDKFAKKVKSKIPSKPWLIFMGCSGLIASAIYYDKQEKKKIQKRLIDQVSFYANRPISTDTHPRKVMVCMAAPMGTSLRKLKVHFEEYIEPIFDAAALDYEFIDSRIDGGVRSKIINLVHKRKQEEADPSLYRLPIEIPVQPQISFTEDLIAFGRASYREMLEGLNQGFLSQPPKEYIKDINKINKKKKTIKPTPDKKDENKKKSIFNFKKNNKIEDKSKDTTKIETPETPSTPKKEIKEEEDFHLKFSEDYLPDFDITPIVGLISFNNLVGRHNFGRRVVSWFNERKIAENYGKQAVAVVVGKHVPFEEERDCRLGLFEERRVVSKKTGPLPKMYRMHQEVARRLRIIQDFGIPDENDTERRVDNPNKGRKLVNAFGRLGEPLEIY